MQKYIEKKYLLNNLKEENITSLLPVQTKMFEEFNKSKDIILKAKTGSGKTYAYLLPILNQLEITNKLGLLIVVPTNELAYQIYLVIKNLIKNTNYDLKLYDSNTSSPDEATKLLKKQPNIVVGTIGKIFDLAFRQNALKIHNLEYFVLDEADMALDNNFKNELDEILISVKESKKIFVSATIKKDLEILIKKYCNIVKFIDFNDLLENKIEHIWLPVRHHHRLDVLNNLLKIINPYLCLIFISKKEDIPLVYNDLASNGYNVVMLSSNLDIRERKRILREINDLRYQYVITSDILARGMDFKGVSHVISYDLPYDFEFYIHRSGRTARVNTSGISYALYDRLDDNYLDMLAKKGVKPTYYDIVGNELVPYKGRNVRQNRKRAETNYEAIANKMIPKSKKIKPGHNKKRQALVKELAEKLKNNDKKRGRRK